jgi:hypothetical protein
MPNENKKYQERRNIMPKRNKRSAKKLRNLIVVSTFSAILLIVATYAWFIGMQTVNVNSFDIEIKTTESLQLALDGVSWSDSVTISQEDFADAYEGNTNSWGGAGLIPMSSVGEMDTTSSRMKLYEKASLTATPGGYRLMASLVNNSGAQEAEGYVAFDLFIKNFSGSQYIEELEELDEEAIYLTVDSEVTVALDGGVADTGIENSVRVAFGQIGRVAGTTTADTVIQSITCSDDEENHITGICRTAQIWEPNDTKHVPAAISWYETSCLPREADGEDVTDPDSYDDEGSCGTIIDGEAYPTYAVKEPITSADHVDIYDGLEYNKYLGTTKLEAYPYFTDTHRDMTGTSRPTFMTLAPNSITKVRIYVYIEGQDIDNYDFASIGKKITVKFGFTKERYTEDDINYQGPPLNPDEI